MSTTPEHIHTVATRRDGQPVSHGSDRPTLAWPDRGAGGADVDRTTRHVTVGHQQLRVDVRKIGRWHPSPRWSGSAYFPCRFIGS